MPFRRFIKVTDNGTVKVDLTTKAKPSGDDWIEISRDNGQHDIMGNEPHCLRYTEEEGLVKKKRVRISVGAFTWVADGVTKNAIGVRGEELVDTDEVALFINNKVYNITRLDDVMLKSSKPGRYIVRLDDPYYYATPGELELWAVEKEETDA